MFKPRLSSGTNIFLHSDFSAKKQALQTHKLLDYNLQPQLFLYLERLVRNPLINETRQRNLTF